MKYLNALLPLILCLLKNRPIGLKSLLLYNRNGYNISYYLFGVYYFWDCPGDYISIGLGYILVL